MRELEKQNGNRGMGFGLKLGFGQNIDKLENGIWLKCGLG